MTKKKCENHIRSHESPPHLQHAAFAPWSAIFSMQYHHFEYSSSTREILPTPLNQHTWKNNLPKFVWEIARISYMRSVCSPSEKKKIPRAALRNKQKLVNKTKWFKYAEIREIRSVKGSNKKRFEKRMEKRERNVERICAERKIEKDH